MKRLLASLCLCACGGSGGSDTSASSSSSSSDGETSATSLDPSTSGSSGIATSDGGTTGTDESSSDDAVDGSSYILEPDGGGSACGVDVQCDAWAQDCPAGEKCVPAECATEYFSRTRCVPVADDPAQVGEPCTVQEGAFSGLDDCALGSVCWYLDDALEGTCVAQCTNSEANPQCEAELSCDFGFDAVATLCLAPCDPIAPDCPAGQLCMHGDRGGSDFGHFVCQPAAPLFAVGDAGAECNGYGLACAAGLACVGSQDVPGCASQQCCTPLGELASPPACPDKTQSCIAAYPDGDAPAGLDDLCFCGVPE